MKVYLDTCIISGIAKQDIKDEDLVALTEILKMHKDNKVEIVTSEVAKEELNKIPPEYRSKHLMVYNLLNNVPTVEYLKLNFFSVGFPVKQTKEFGELFSLLKDKGDAQYIYQAFRNGVDFFLTVDKKTILSHHSDIQSICGVKVLSPNRFISVNDASMT